MNPPPGHPEPVTPRFLLDPDTGTRYFWAVNPHCAS